MSLPSAGTLALSSSGPPVPLLCRASCSLSAGTPVPSTFRALSPLSIYRKPCPPFCRGPCCFLQSLLFPLLQSPVSPPVCRDPCPHLCRPPVPHLAEPKGDSQACPPSTDEDPEADQEPNPWERVRTVISTHGETEAGKGSTAAHAPGTAAVRQAGASGRTCSWGSPRTPCKLSIDAFPLNPS